MNLTDLNPRGPDGGGYADFAGAAGVVLPGAVIFFTVQVSDFSHSIVLQLLLWFRIPSVFRPGFLSLAVNVVLYSS